MNYDVFVDKCYLKEGNSMVDMSQNLKIDSKWTKDEFSKPLVEISEKVYRREIRLESSDLERDVKGLKFSFRWFCMKSLAPIKQIRFSWKFWWDPSIPFTIRNFRPINQLLLAFWTFDRNFQRSRFADRTSWVFFRPTFICCPPPPTGRLLCFLLWKTNTAQLRS